MNLGTSSLTYFSSCRLLRAGSPTEPPVVWLRGDHDGATRDVLAATLAEAIALDEPAVVVDLSGVHFLNLVAIGVILDAKRLLTRRCRSLVLREASASVRRAFGVFGLGALLERESDSVAPLAIRGTSALASWVDVPTDRRLDVDDSSETSGPGIRFDVESATTGRPLFVRSR